MNPSEHDWRTASPESQQMVSEKLEAIWNDLQSRHTTAFVVIRNDHIVFEGYATGHGRTAKHYTASLAKALIGGVSLMLAMNDGRLQPDDLASKFVPQWADDPQRKSITIRHLATHTSGIEDAEAEALPHDQLSGWKGDFWKRLPPPKDTFTISRNIAPVLEAPGAKARYSNPGMAMLAYGVTASLQGAVNADIRSLLKRRIMEPIGVPESEWSCGYGTTTWLEGMTLIANWGGGSFSPNATARVGRLMLRQGNWNGQQLIASSVVAMATTHAGMPNNSGLGWWVNREADGTKHWQAAPEDAFWGAGAGQQFLLVIPSLNLIVVRNGELMDQTLNFDQGLETYIVNPLLKAFAFASSNVSDYSAPYPPSPVIKGITWAPKETIIRQAHHSDCWPITWGDDDYLYTAYGDGYGFEPKVPEKLSLGLAKVSGSPPDFTGVNIRSPSGERKGDGAKGLKASGMLMVNGVLYMWVRNVGNSQLAWSTDYAKTWTWSHWKFTASFGYPTFLNFGKNYAESRDDYVYVYSHDSDSAYTPSDRMLLARAPKDQIANRDACEFFKELAANGEPRWTKDVAQCGAVFTHLGRCYRSGISYNAALKRYLWCQIIPATVSGGDTRFSGGFGIYDAPELWGPWTTVYFTEQWDVGPGETSSFPTKWMSAAGRTVHLLFSGDDYFSVRPATLIL